MQMHLAPALGEGHLLGRRDDLVAEEDRAVVQQRLVNLAEGTVVELFGQIDAVQLGPHGPGDWPYVDSRISHDSDTPAMVPATGPIIAGKA